MNYHTVNTGASFVRCAHHKYAGYSWGGNVRSLSVIDFQVVFLDLCLKELAIDISMLY